ncbi:MAG: hypothetical protein KF770_22600 [Anaerolineae bacterium]|nr:hypothetical protein [Anaerolineae bacterium]
MAKIYRHRNNAPDSYVGKIDPSNGRVYGEQFGPDVYVGRVDYAKGEVYAHQTGPDKYMGRVDEKQRIYAHQFGPDDYVASVENDGKIYRHVRMGRDAYLGRVEDMRHPVEAAAAWFFFLAPALDETDEAA